MIDLTYKTTFSNTTHVSRLIQNLGKVYWLQQTWFKIVKCSIVFIIIACLYKICIMASLDNKQHCIDISTA